MRRGTCRVLLWVAGALLGLTGCATVTVGRDFDLAALQALKPGTTAAEVIAAIGEPHNRTVMPDGAELWTYMAIRSEAVAVPMPFYTHVETGSTSKSASLIFRDGKLVRSPSPLSPIVSPFLPPIK